MASTPVKPPRAPRKAPSRLAEAKASRVGALIAVGGDGQPAWTPRRFDALAHEAYVLNVVANVCISKITKAISALPLMVEQGSVRSDQHPVLDLIRSPNPMQRQLRFLRAVTAFHKICGNSYIEAVRPKSGPPRELWCLRPDRVAVLEGETGIPAGYRYETHKGRVDFMVDPVSGRCDLLHMREFHPLNDWYGMADTEAAARSIDQFNAASAHNAALLQNGVKPSGFLVVKTSVSPEVIERAEAVIADKWAGTDNAGKVHVLGGDWSFVETGQTFKDMEFYEGIQQRTREICAAYGVPHVLVVPGEATYSNRDQAYLELYEATILPEADTLLDDIGQWLKQWFPGRWRLTYDKDQIWALTLRRVEHRKQVVMEFEKRLITRDEAREALQYEPAADGGGEYFGVAAPAEPAEPKPEPPPQVPVKAKSIEPEDIGGDVPDEAMTATVMPVLRDIVSAYGQRVFEELAIEASFSLLDPRVTQFLEEFGATRIRQLVGTTTRRELAETLRDGVANGESTADLVKRIRGVFTEASRERAQMIAETEMTNASGFAGQVAMDEAGVQFKVWSATVDDLVRDTHRAMDGQIQPAGEPYVSPSGARGMHPGGFDSAAESVRCRCASLVFIPGIDGPLPENLRARFQLDEDGEPVKSARRTKRRQSLAQRRKAREAMRGPLEARLLEAVRKGFAEQEAYVVRRLRLAAVRIVVDAPKPAGDYELVG